MLGSIYSGLLTLATLKEITQGGRLPTEGGAPAGGASFTSASAMLLAVGLTAVVAFILVLPNLIRRWRQRNEPIPMPPRPRRLGRRQKAPTHSEGTASLPLDGKDPFIPVNYNHVPSAGMVSRRERARKALAFGVSHRPEDLDPHLRARLLQRKLAAHEQKIRSQQERMAWLEERLQTLNEELRTLRTLLHERTGADDDGNWRPPLNRLVD